MVVSEKTMNQRQEIPIKRLMESELQARKEKGLCFKCDEKFSRGHRCKKELRVLLVHEDEDEEDNQFDSRATEEPSLIELKDVVVDPQFRPPSTCPIRYLFDTLQ